MATFGVTTQQKGPICVSGEQLSFGETANIFLSLSHLDVCYQELFILIPLESIRDFNLSHDTSLQRCSGPCNQNPLYK